MPTYLICYDLNKEGAAYAEANKNLTDHIKQAFPTYWHNLDSTWVVVSDMTADEICRELLSDIDDNDELMVVGSSGEGSWTGFSDRASSWLEKHL